MVMLEGLFWLSVLALGYIYVGYPVLIGLMARRFPQREQPGRPPQAVSLVVVGHNEADNLARKIPSILACEGQAMLQEIVIACDGSTDNTAEVVRSFEDSRILLREFDSRRGKPAVLNEVIPTCQGEIIVLCDARQKLDPHALQHLLANFLDESVGVVSGELVFEDNASQSTVAQGIGFYWKYEKWIRRQESEFRSVPGASGAFYAIRRELFQPIPDQTILDDVAIPMNIVLQGKRCLLEPRAVIFDRPSQATRQESVRKRRTIAGVVQLMLQHPSWLLPWKNPIWWEFMSHKVARLLSPLFLLLAMGTHLALASQPFYGWLLWVHGWFYLAAASGWVLQLCGKRSRLLGPALMFLSLNLTTLAALWDALRGRFQVTWKRAV